jgi:putative membrane protein insertion efficiency factor
VEKVRMWPRDAALAIIKAYQRFVSPLLPPSCRFTPSCSQYALMAIEKHGLLRGTFMGTVRVLRCNPFSKGGFDPVR